MSLVTVFFDGSCPLCAREMDQLARYDRLSRIHFVDLNDDAHRYPTIDREAALHTLHVLDANGTLRKGVDANVLLWETVGRKAWLRILRWPIVRQLADIGYRFFADHREWFSLVLTGQRRCTGHCDVPKDAS